ncbi:DUF192 domain-containing protein [Glaciimonas sp. PAMC28666]|uniref:DUF192 domain-containing protein n=1 Tax=Glaciimonas sp. PAMC28666 TaxID=2807626 RepID=UPI0019638283|nr:DUF192 domain-containing protein [Glaciimonas sp. PAMC28666]QRX81399.1 DUF192 domain-containing protein [Glaciimonas sp. PAMC28666]
MQIEIQVAHNFWQRAVGLLGKSALSDHQALLISPCSSIHMCFMQFPIDAIFLDGTGNITRIAANLRPWQFAAAKAVSCLELSAGNAERLGLQAGDCLSELGLPISSKVIQMVFPLPPSSLEA